MREYLYLDEKRIAAYHEQISSPMKYDKVPMWKFSLGLTNTAVEGSQTRFARDATLHEKLEKVTAHLLRSNLLTIGRPVEHRWPLDHRGMAVFAQEVLNARKLRFRKADPPIYLWFSDDLVPSEWDRPEKAIFLIEDYSADDSQRQSRLSGYSSLMLLYHTLSEMPGEGGGRIIHDQLKDDASQAFSKAPFDALVSLGAESGQPQRVEVIYRIRAHCCAKEDSYDSNTTIGYPIAIWASS